jgi:hypothetical protein
MEFCHEIDEALEIGFGHWNLARGTRRNSTFDDFPDEGLKAANEVRRWGRHGNPTENLAA